MAYQTGGGGFQGHGGDDQDRLLDEATSVVKEQAYFMRKAMDSDNLREALKHSSNLICELRTSLLSPKNYYELYMQVFQEMQHLSNFFGDKARHGRKMVELYESVQHAGSILPRLYLLATVGASYIKSKETSAKEILKDLNELTKGVQHPMRGLFLRYYMSQMVKDKLPDTGSEYEGEGGNIDDAFDFIFTNFSESNRLWVRMQQQVSPKDKAKREKERHDLRVLVGSNLVRMSQLEGMTLDYYSDIALPKILSHIVVVKDTMSQQYLFESMIQVFPDEFHIKTLQKVLEAYSKATPSVDMKPIMVALMGRLANYLTNTEDLRLIANIDVFSLLRTHLQAILERALDPVVLPTPTGASGPPIVPDVAPPLDVQVAFMNFTISLYPDKVHYVDIILGSTSDLILKYFVRICDVTNKLNAAGADRVVELLSCPLKTLGLVVLEMEHYTNLLRFLSYHTRKQVALNMAEMVVAQDKSLTSVDAITQLFSFISPLIRDEDDTPANEGKDKEQFAAEQQAVAKLVHQVRVGDDIDTEFAILTEMRKYFGQGGPHRMVHTLQTTYFGALGLISKMQALERRRVEEGDTVQMPTITLKKVFQFLHKTNTALAGANSEIGLQLWLTAAGTADRLARTYGDPGSYEPICSEFLTQALILFEEEITDSARQFSGIYLLVGAMSRITCLDPESMDNISAKITKHGARLLKKPLQCRAIATCSHLFWSDSRRDGKRVLECLQRCLKITEAVVASEAKQVGLWVEMLDKYAYYCEVGCADVSVGFVQDLIHLCLEHIDFAEKDAVAMVDAQKAKAHLANTVNILRVMKRSENANRFAALSLENLPI